MTQAGQPQSWSDLPTELAGLVLCRLPAYSDRVRFGAVCRHWSFSATQHCLPQPVPFLVFPDGTFFSLPQRESFQFPDSVGYHSSCGEWLVFLSDGTYSLKNPFSKVTLMLPKLSDLCPIDEPEEIVDFPVTLEGEIPQESLDVNAEMSVYKLVVCSSFLAAAIVNLGPLYTIALCRPGADSWLVSKLLRRDQLMDMMFYEGKLYVLDEFKNLLAIDVGEDNDNGRLSISQVKCLIETLFDTFRLAPNGMTSINHFLVESHGALLRVRTTFFGMLSDDGTDCMSTKAVATEFKVFEADFHSSRWVDVTSVGDDRALFISQSYSRSLSVSQYKLKGNRIFILDDGTCDWFWNALASSYTVYSMSDGGGLLTTALRVVQGQEGTSGMALPHLGNMRSLASDHVADVIYAGFPLTIDVLHIISQDAISALGALFLRHVLLLKMWACPGSLLEHFYFQSCVVCYLELMLCVLQ